MKISKDTNGNRIRDPPVVAQCRNQVRHRVLASEYELFIQAYPLYLNRRVHNPTTLVSNIRHLHPARTALHVRIHLVRHVRATCTAVP